MRLIARKSKRGSGILVESIAKRLVIIRAAAGAFKAWRPTEAVTFSEIGRYVDWFAFLLTDQAARNRLSSTVRLLR